MSPAGQVAPTATAVAEPALVFDPAAEIPFFAYRRFDSDGPFFELCPSLVHHFESEKFRCTDEALRRAVLDCATAKLAQKLAKKHMDRWRTDWKSVRGRVFRAGLAMQVVQSRKALAAAKGAFFRSMEICDSKKIGGLPSTFIANQLTSFFQKAPADTSGRIGVVALGGCVPNDIDARLDALFQVDKPLSATIYAGADADPAVEQWCIKNAVPVRLSHLDAGRLRDTLAQDLTLRINTLVLCLPVQRKASKAVLSAAKARRPRLKLINLSLQQ